MVYRNGNYEKSGNDLCMTPNNILEDIKKEFGDYFDPCPRNYDGSFDGLNIEWGNVNFVNPPYSQLKDWIKKCHEEWLKNKTVILLIPPRTCTSYFHDYIYGKAELRFFRGRLKFLNPDTGQPMKAAPFPSMLCIFKGGKQNE